MPVLPVTRMRSSGTPSRQQVAPRRRSVGREVPARRSRRRAGGSSPPGTGAQMSPVRRPASTCATLTLRIERGERGARTRWWCRPARSDHAGPHLCQDGRPSAVQHPRGDAGRGPGPALIRSRSKSGTHAEQVQHAGRASRGAGAVTQTATSNPRGLVQAQHDRGELDGLGTGAEDEEQGGRRCAQRDTSFSPTGAPRCEAAEQKPHPSAPVARLSRGRRTADRDSRSSRVPGRRTRPVDSRAAVPVAPTPPSVRLRCQRHGRRRGAGHRLRGVLPCESS